MMKTMGWKIVLILAVIVFSVVMSYPPSEKINLGLDLKGGMHLVFRVETDEAIQGQTDNAVVRLKGVLKQHSIQFEKVIRQGRNKIDIIGTSYEHEERLRDRLDEEFREWDYIFTGTGVALSLRPNVEMRMKEQTVNQALGTIQNRVDEFGVASPVFQRQGSDRLLIELPGVSDKEKRRIMGLIRSTAMLEFKKMVDYGPYPTEADALKKYNGVLPDDLMILKWTAGHPRYKGYSVLQAANVITGRDMKNAQHSLGEFSAPQVNFSLDSNGAGKFRTFTAANVGQHLAIVLDKKIISAPVIQDVLSYESMITGNFTVEETEDLALKLRSGALPAPLRIEHEQIIGPSLGGDSIRKGLYACIVGLFLVMVFMLFYYRTAGINSIIALALNMVILLGILAYFKATLTLPGIAGIILTIGMAVDANVLIFERIKEDLRAGKAPKSAIDSGFKKAFVTILDANLTTIIAAIFLFQFGTSAVKGFAVTLMIGIVASMFTAVFVSRVIFDLIYAQKKKLKTISI
ncbi:MAG: protein translocase subunit SecD [Candidatus Aminicenantes bacterium]|nr:protein translocase subunit SecD [Candidatus Aminicenantes bacterium]NIM82786.1 protein translocase subunit SecD [Candidatus Aminicenantes bacterium]NIN22161.1 protein translocase subunit SecD [Candidatus Aminicenantes bacterium]NIN41158.1 protein translocase subunit SecD [Candidatus Aminicenantes bacterium]NIN88757.1 protein translocase subunit SecD [Candidatus Aminicenantes bacterium]